MTRRERRLTTPRTPCEGGCGRSSTGTRYFCSPCISRLATRSREAVAAARSREERAAQERMDTEMLG